MFNEFKCEFMGYAKEKNILGDVAEMNFLERTITLEDEKGTLRTFKREDVVLLNHIVDIGEIPIYEHDVLGSIKGDMFEVVEGAKENTIELHLLDKKFNRIVKTVYTKSYIEECVDLTLLGNIFQLMADLKTVDFNIKIVKDVSNGVITYFYACNNKEKEEVDLIKVLFLGHQLLKEENYTRTTFSHDEYLVLVDNGILKEVNPNELLNYVTGVTYGKNYESDVCCEEDVCKTCLSNQEDNEEDNLW